MTWSAVGSWEGASTAALSLTNQAVGNLIVVEVLNFSNATVWCTGLTGGGATWTQAGVKFTGTNNAFSAAVFLGKVTATGSQTATPTWSGTTPGSYGIAAQEFHSTAGAWVFDQQANLDASGANSNWPALIASFGTGELYFGYSVNAGSASSGSTSGYVYNPSADGVGNGAAYNVNCPATSTFPAWADTGQVFGIVIQVAEGSAPGPAPPGFPAWQPQPPGWFPGADRVTTEPDGIPFYAQPIPVIDPGAVIIPPTPDPAPFQQPAIPPGWFPGADRVTAEPDGIPFTPAPVVIAPNPAVIFPVPEVAGVPDWLPLPPGYFPGSQTVTVDPGGIPFYAQPQPLLPPVPPPGPPYISGLKSASGTSYFVDTQGNPKLLLAENPWAILAQAGTVGGGPSFWRSDMENYLVTRAQQGFTGIYVSPYGNAENQNTFHDGRNINGDYPFNGDTPSLSPTPPTPVNNPSNGLNNAFWTKIDYFITRAQQLGLTVLINIGYTGGTADFDTGGCLGGKTTQQYTDYGTALAGRYAANGNIIWLVGNDYFGSYDTQYAAILTALRAAGDTHLISIHNDAESTSRFDLSPVNTLPWGTAHAQFNSCYSYDTEYLATEAAYAEASPLTVMHLDGYFYPGGTTYAGGTGFAYDRSMRQEHWWALASGARGHCSGDEHIWTWPSVAQSQASTGWFWVNNAGNIRAAIEALPGWFNLLPATGSTLITAGRGTRNTQYTSGGGHGQYEPAFTNNYVAASLTPDGTLALMYLPLSTTITIDESKVGGPGNYTATWIDPISGATSSAGSGPTFNSTAKGNNSQGDPDWALTLQGPGPAPVPPGFVYQPPPGWFPGADQVSAIPGEIPFYVAPQPTDQNAPSSAGGSVTHPVTAAWTGTGTFTASAAFAASALWTGTGTFTAAVQKSVPVAVAWTGTSTFTASAAFAASATWTGTGTFGATAQKSVPVAVAWTGTGTFTASAAFAASASWTGTGTFTAAVQKSVPVAATWTGTGTFSATVQKSVPIAASWTGTGTFTANVAGSGATHSGGLILVLPPGKRKVAGTQVLSLPVMTFSLTGVMGRKATLSAVIPVVQAAITGRLATEHATIAPALPVPSFSLAGVAQKNVTAPLAITLPALTAPEAGVIGHVGNFTLDFTPGMGLIDPSHRYWLGHQGELSLQLPVPAVESNSLFTAIPDVNAEAVPLVIKAEVTTMQLGCTVDVRRT